ncbi:MAG: nickel/cobalt efflux transporter RcnA [Pseudomonadota bacterium]|nr:nickel/cobalt efflux transporter RcnA [Pseudomonadota bacterium]
MQSLTDLLQQGASHAWLFLPTAVLLGALHGLEPGHSKTMMAAFIIAVRGTVTQAVLLGLSAAISHTAVVWIVALGGQYLGRAYAAEAIEPYLQIASALIVAGVALWMIWRTRREHDHEHDHHHHHAHGHGEESRRIDTGHGVLTLEIHEHDAPPRFRLTVESGQGWRAQDVVLVTERADQSRQAFAFVDKGDYLESVEEIPEPHDFLARLTLTHGGHAHDYDVTFVEAAHAHEHDPLHDEARGLALVEGGEYMDAHARAHADDIARRFRGREVTTWQIVLFGLTGGLIPCPAAITVLLLCLQLKRLALGVTLVGGFSLGLAITMVSAGAIAALGARHAQKRWSGFGSFIRRAPYASGALMLLVAAYMGVSGWMGLAAV